MNIIKTTKVAAAIIIVAALGACAIVPDSIDVADASKLVPFDRVNKVKTQSPDSNISLGEKARWGGKIVAVENKKDASEIEIVFFPETDYGKPKTSMPSMGRFKAVVEGFVDPLVFEQGRLITVVGEVGNMQTGIIGEQEYAYPTLNAKGYYMWKETTDIKVELDTFGFYPFGYHSGFNRSYFNPWYDPWYTRNQRYRMRVNKYNGHSQGSTVSPSQSQGQRPTSSPSTSRSTNQKRDAARIGTQVIEK